MATAATRFASGLPTDMPRLPAAKAPMHLALASSTAPAPHETLKYYQSTTKVLDELLQTLIVLPPHVRPRQQVCLTSPRDCASDGPAMSLLRKVKSISMMTNLKKAWANLCNLKKHIKPLHAPGDNVGAMAVEIKALQTQIALREWKVALGQIGHEKLMESGEQSSAPSALRGVNLFQLAMSLPQAGRASMLASLLNEAVPDASPQDKRERSTNASSIQCHFCLKLGTGSRIVQEIRTGTLI